MPNVIVGALKTLDWEGTTTPNFKYHYEEGRDWTPGKELHQRIVSKLIQYAKSSSAVVSARHPAWNSMDEKLIGYIPLSDAEKLIKKKDSRRPVSIIFPYTYAILETLISYMVAAFLPEPILRYEGQGPEDLAGGTLLEKLINLHCNRNKVGLNLHTMFRDAGAYGFAAASPQWTVKRGKKIVKKPIGFADAQGNITSDGFDRGVEDAILFEGNSLENIDPYRYLPDPCVPIHEPQKGEFVGWLDTSNYLDLLSEEQFDDDFFNVRYLRQLVGKRTGIFNPTNSSNIGGRQYGQASWERISQGGETSPIDLLNLYVKLIPNSWGLGPSQYPEKWLFTVAADSVIIRAKPLGLHHDMFPIIVCAPDFDGYSPIAYSRLEVMSGMQTVIDWLFNAHIANVRKAINDVLIVDPYLINMKDLRDPDAGWLVRLRRPAWGRGVENAVKQLNVSDITARNMQDVALTIQYMQQIGGTDNAVMGNLRQGGPDRLTSAEFKGTAQGAVSRLERVAKVIGMQALQDMGYMFAYHAQQLMSQEVYVKSVGGWPDSVVAKGNVNGDRAKVGPDDIIVDYDLLVKDGSIPGGNFATIWTDMLKVLVENPGIGQQFDIVGIFEYIATSLGAKNVEQFRLQGPQQVNVGAAPDEAIARQAQAGNLVPIRGALGG